MGLKLLHIQVSGHARHQRKVLRVKQRDTDEGTLAERHKTGNRHGTGKDKAPPRFPHQTDTAGQTMSLRRHNKSPALFASQNYQLTEQVGRA